MLVEGRLKILEIIKEERMDEIYLVFEKMRRGLDNQASFAGASAIFPEYLRNFFLKAYLFSS